jgi:PKD repeat protein
MEILNVNEFTSCNFLTQSLKLKAKSHSVKFKVFNFELWFCTFRFTLFAILVSLCFLNCPAAHAAVGPNWIEQWGITWTFDKPITNNKDDPGVLSGNKYLYGTFVNDDYWVVGPVNIVMIDPMSTDIGGVIRHGTMINPKSGDINTSFNSGRHTYQGFDSRRWNYDASYNKGRPKGNDISVSNPMIVPTGSSVVSAISRQEQGSWPDKNMQLLTAAVLTVLDKASAAGSFRPGYCGDDKSVKFNINDLDESKLCSYPLVGDYLPALAQGTGSHGANDSLYQDDTLERIVERPWLDFAHDIGGAYLHPQYNIQPDGAWIARQVGEIALVLNSSNYTPAQKRKLLIRFVQVGIDNYSVHQGANVAWDTWMADGQVGPGRKFPILFAGMMLNDSQMSNIGDYGVEGVGYVKPGYIAFAEDEQTFYVSQENVDISNLPGWNPDFCGDGGITPYSASEIGLPEWGYRHAFGTYWDNYDWNADYRSNANYWAGFVLAAHMMNMKSLWKHNALFDYMDRYMAIVNNAQAPTWVGKMWAAYRAGAPTASFTVTPTSGNKPLQAYFDASASSDVGGSIVNYAWHFGDSSTAAGVTASHTYTNSGSFTCSLIVTDNDGKTATTTRTITVTEPVVPGCTLSTTSFQNQSFTNQTGSFTAEFDVTANATGIDGVIGLSANPATSYTDLACIVRFNDQGYIDVRNGAGYTSLNTVSYASGVKYHLKLEVNISSHTYSVYVTPQGSSTVTLATNYVFRSEQSTVTSLSNIGMIHYYNSFQFCNFTLNTASIIYGDISGDGALSAYDAALAARIAVGLDAYPTGDNLTKADVSGDGFVTAYDAALIAQKAVGLITKFPVES